VFSVREGVDRDSAVDEQGGSVCEGCDLVGAWLAGRGILQVVYRWRHVICIFHVVCDKMVYVKAFAREVLWTLVAQILIAVIAITVPMGYCTIDGAVKVIPVYQTAD
jgi:hypothetical protein